MFRDKAGGGVEAALLGLDCASFLSPASDLAHLVLTSGPPSLARAEWEEIVAEYYSLLTSTLARFGLVLRHLGTSLAHFKAEVISTHIYSYLAKYLRRCPAPWPGSTWW